MTQEQFNEMLAVAIAQGIGGGTYILTHSGEEIDRLLDYVQSIMPATTGETGVINNA